MTKEEKNSAAYMGKNSAPSLAFLGINESGIICKIEINNDAKRRLFDLGLIVGTTVKALFRSTCGDPTAFLVRGTVIALRSEYSKKIYIF